MRDATLVGAVLVGSMLRLWDLGTTTLSIDETYSALAARMPWHEIVGHIDATDPHGPLAYLVLQPVASLTDHVGWLRSVSALASVAALVTMAVWQRREGIAGLVATVIFAVAPFQIFFARQIRMYGILALLGVVAAWAAQRWLEDRARRWVFVMAAAGLAASLTHATGPILIGGLLLIPGVRKDRAAWELRAALAASSAAFVVLWGGHALRWSGNSWFPPVTPDSASIVVNETIAPVPGNRWLVLALAAVGVAALLGARGSRARVWLCLFGAPLAVLYLASLDKGILLPKSLVLFGWALPVALGALCAWLMARSRLLAGAAIVVIALLVVPYVVDAMHQDEGSALVIEKVFGVVPVDESLGALASSWQVESLVGWYGQVEGRRPIESVERRGALKVFVPHDAIDTDRVWLVVLAGDENPDGYVACSRAQPVGSFVVQCLEPAP